MKLILASLLVFGSVSIPTAAQAQYAMTCTRDVYSSVNLRRGPGQNHGIIASVPNASYVRLLSWVWGADGMRWYRVENGGIVGYARSDYLCR